jgi:hypothetical protein
MKKGQVSIFITIGIILVVALVLFFVFKEGLIPNPLPEKESNQNAFLEACIESKVKDTINIIGLQGGYVHPEFSFKFKFEDEEYQNISYLCYNENYYLPCINQEPMLIQHIKDEIKNEIKSTVEDCYNEMVLNLEKDNYEIKSKKYRDFEVEIIPRKININIDAEISAKKNDIDFNQKGFKVSVNSYLYELAVVAQEILSQEGEYCNFEVLGFMLYNPIFKIDKFKTGDSRTIYTIKHKKSKEFFRFAVRGCVIPPGR